MLRIALTLCLALVALGLEPGAALAQACYERQFTRISDPWGCEASCGRTSPHRGVDFPNPSGTPIRAPASGVVRIRETTSCLGNVLVIEHADGIFSGYGHMRALSPIPLGASVTRGDVIGEVGNTGTCTTGPHLHMTMGTSANSIYSGPTIDPVAYMDSHLAGPGCDDGGGLALLHEQPSAYAAPRTTDLDGDGRADFCARASDGVNCWTSTGTGWSEGWAVVPWSDPNGWTDPANYATLRMGDLNGDGRADLCGRSNDAFLCALSTGTGFAPPTVWRDGISDANGWAAPEHYTTIRLADVDGDGREDLCARDATRFGCWLSDGTKFDRRVDGPGWSNAAGFTLPHYYGTLRMGDVDGDGRADVCIRGGAGMQCVLSDGTAFTTVVPGPEWSDASGFTSAAYWSTLRLADFNGDGRDDLCVRTSTDLRCTWSTGTGFAETVIVGALSDANAWGDRANYATLRVGDVDGDGAEDLCARGDGEMGCWTWTGTAFVQRAGPAWSDANGWGASPAYYQTIRLADFDGDGRDDLCARSGAGWTCHSAMGVTFATAGVEAGQITDPGGWAAAPHYWGTILSAGPRCRPSAEICNERDDDCDGEVDEMACGVPDAGVVAGDASAMSARDAGGDVRPPSRLEPSGCGCRVGRSDRGLSWLLGALVLALMLARRRRAR